MAHFTVASAGNPANVRVKLEIAGILRDQFRIEEADQIFRELEEQATDEDLREIQSRRFEHYCSTMQLERAAASLASWGDRANIPPGAVPFAASFYATRGQWDEVIALFRERFVESDPPVRLNPLLLEALARATRATGAYAETLAILARLPKVASNPAVEDLQNQLVEEAQLLHIIGLRNNDGDARSGSALTSTFRAQRAELLNKVLEPADRASEVTIYLCTDRAYLPGGVVAAFSLLRHNLAGLRRYALRIFTSDDVFEFAAEVFSSLAGRFSIPIECSRATSLLTPGSDLRTAWGIFTPGHSLSEAAYYRIYVALHLLESGVQGRALYIDSDACVGPRLDQLLDFDLKQQPLGARIEISTQVEIRRAAAKLGVAPELYFNSGVLLFDLAHPQLGPALRHAIDISVNQKHLLTFVDQCALNLAFQGKYTPLPEEFNSFVRQETKPEAILPSPVIRHFLQRPKPWDPMYSSPNCMLWLEEFSALGQFLEPRQLKRILGLQFKA